MLISRIRHGAVFNPEAVKALAAAFDGACAALNVIDRTDPRATIVAKKISSMRDAVSVIQSDYARRH
jgi:hypothetical protein